MAGYKKYKIVFTNYCSLEGLYSQIKVLDLKRVPALEVLDMKSHPGLADFAADPKTLIKILLENSPDFMVTYNDTVSFFTKLSLLLGIPKIRVQDDDPANIKWRVSYLYDTESPLSFISTVTEFKASKYNGRLQEILNDVMLCDNSENIWQSPSFVIANSFGIKDAFNKEKDIDIVFIGDVNEVTAENLFDYLSNQLFYMPQEAIREIHGMLLDLAGTWEMKKEAYPAYNAPEWGLFNECYPLYRILLNYDISRDKWGEILNTVFTLSLSSIRRINVLKGLINRFGQKYSIKLYGGYQLAKSVSLDHYYGMAFGGKKEDVFRRSKIQIHSHNNLLYNATRMLESYRYSCLCLSNFCAGAATHEAGAPIEDESLLFVPKFGNIQELYALCEHYLSNEKERIDTVEKVLSLIPKDVDVSKRVNAYMRFFDHAKNMNIKVNPFAFPLLQYDHEVIELCGLIEQCCLELGLNEKSSYYKELKEHFTSMLEAGYREKPERALAFAYYNFQNNYDSVKALQIIDTYCADLGSARVFKGKMHILQGNFREAIDLLSSFSCGDAGDEAYRLSYLSSAYQSIGDYVSALDSMLMTLDLMYPLPHLHYYIAFLYYLLNDFGKAKEYLLVNTGIEKLFLPAFQILGEICFEKFKEFEVAYDAYNTAAGIVSISKGKDWVARYIYFLDRMAFCKLHIGRLGEAGALWKMIIEDFDDQNIDAHCKLFFLLLATNTRDALWQKESSFIIGKGVNLKVMYQKVRDYFPSDIVSNLDKAIGALK